jgi:hypothetical protein
LPAAQEAVQGQGGRARLPTDRRGREDAEPPGDPLERRVSAPAPSQAESVVAFIGMRRQPIDPTPMFSG